MILPQPQELLDALRIIRENPNLSLDSKIGHMGAIAPWNVVISQIQPELVQKVGSSKFEYNVGYNLFASHIRTTVSIGTRGYLIFEKEFPNVANKLQHKICWKDIIAMTVLDPRRILVTQQNGQESIAQFDNPTAMLQFLITSSRIRNLDMRWDEDDILIKYNGVVNEEQNRN